MWKGSYGKEPFDLRLTIFRLLYMLPAIAAVTLAGTLVFGGGYYVKNVLLRGQRYYAATSFYRVEYAVDDPEDMANVYINEMTWNTYMQSRMFLDAVRKHLTAQGMEDMAEEELAGAIDASVLSDLRVPSVTVTVESPEKALGIIRAVNQAMTGELAEEISEIRSITVIDPGEAAEEVIPDVRPGRAFGLSAVLSCFFAVIVLLLKETGDDSIWLPSSLWRRYGLKTAGTSESRELSENIRYFFGEALLAEEQNAARVAVCAVQPKMNAEEVLDKLKKRCPDSVRETWFAVQSPLEHPEVCRELRKAEGILLAVRAGSHAGKLLERVLEYLEQQDCPVTAGLLWDADEKLLHRYYRFERHTAGKGQGKE